MFHYSVLNFHMKGYLSSVTFNIYILADKRNFTKNSYHIIIKMQSHILFQLLKVFNVVFNWIAKSDSSSVKRNF